VRRRHRQYGAACQFARLPIGTIRRLGSWTPTWWAHSGPTADGSFVQTLTLTDIATGWTECPQLAAERLLRDADLVFLPDPLAEIDDPPADHAVHRRVRAVLDHHRKHCALLVIEPRRLAGSRAVDQSPRTVRVEPQNPITHNLQHHPASRRRLRAAASIVDQCQRQQSPDLIGVPLARARPRSPAAS
jgi:hypothetical protein